MNIEVEFRGIRKLDSKWVNGFYINIQEKEHYILVPIVLGLSHEQVIPETVGQYTGLKDLKGVKIFEGDIIRSFDSENNEIIHTVVFDSEEARFAVNYKKQNSFDTPMRLTQKWVREFNKQVIGNIHENPELLK